MEIIIQPPKTILYILLAVPAVIIISMLLKKGDIKKKVLSLGLAIVIMVIILFVVYREGSITVDEEGIRAQTFGKIELSWAQVSKAEYVDNFESTEYGIKSKLSGIGIGELKAGRFLLQNGSSAKIVVQKSADALVLTTKDGLVLLAPNKLESLVSEAETYIEIQYKGE